MDKGLHQAFCEFGREGRIYTREQILAFTGDVITAELLLPGFTVHLVGPGVALVTYFSVVEYDTTQVGNRSSLWVNDGTRWRLRFHQGTAVVVDE